MCFKCVSIKIGDYGESHPNGGKWLLAEENILILYAGLYC